MKRTLLAAALAATTSTFAISEASAHVTAKAVTKHYADIALAKYEDALATAKALDSAVDDLIASPSQAKLDAAKQAWLAARVPYQQTEVYRFGNAIVDDWEGRVNAWPLDEGLIDYVDGSYGDINDENALYAANVVANASLKINGEVVDAAAITPEFLSSALHEAGEVEANVATGYHAIEFLLWGQDLNGNGPGAGERPWTDYASGDDCTNAHCDRRGAYLAAASDLLVSDLEEMVANWTAEGEARTTLTDDPKSALSVILTGMGSLSYGELAGERMKLGLLLGDPEEEHDCFADNTHNSHLYDAVGIRNVYNGSYTRVDGTTLEGPSISDLLAKKTPDIDAELKSNLDNTIVKMQTMVQRAETVEAYDQMIGVGNTEGNAVVQAAIDGLVTQTRSIERAVAALELDAIEIEGSDSLDSPDAVFE